MDDFFHQLSDLVLDMTVENGSLISRTLDNYCQLTVNFDENMKAFLDLNEIKHFHLALV